MEIGKLFVDVRTDGPEFQSTRSSPGDDLKVVLNAAKLPKFKAINRKP